MDDSKRPGYGPPRAPRPRAPAASTGGNGPGGHGPASNGRSEYVSSNYVDDDEPTHVGGSYASPAPVQRSPSAGVRSNHAAPTISGVDARRPGSQGHYQPDSQLSGPHGPGGRPGGRPDGRPGAPVRPPPRPDSYRPPLPANRPAAGMPSYSPPPDPYLGQTIAGRYHVLSKLGEGGMGAVYLATHVTLEKQVALKILHSELARRAELVQRFLQEAKAASRIRHENVIDITDFGSTQDGAVFFAMEVLQGQDLHDVITRARAQKRPLSWARLENIFVQVCAALSAAHQCGVIHRDLKPENIYLVERRGTKDFVKLLDFGIAKLTEVSEGDRKLTRTGMLFGTPEYMSPEQARGEKVDHRVDVYAMGCILYQLIVGKVPFVADNFMGVLSRHLSDDPPVIPSSRLHEIGAPRSINEVIQRALAKKPGQRYQSIDELVRALEMVERRTGSMGAVADPRTRVPVARAPSGFDVTAPVTFPDDEEQPDPAELKGTGSGAAGKRRFGGMATAITEPGRTSTEEPGERGARHGFESGKQGEPIAARQVPKGGPKKRSFALMALLLFVLAGAGVGAFAMFGKKSESSKEPVATPRAASASGTVTISLESEPPGAQVFAASGKELGVTPLELEVDRSDQAREFRFVLAGHGDKMISVVPDKARGQQVALRPLGPDDSPGSPDEPGTSATDGPEVGKPTTDGPDIGKPTTDGPEVGKPATDGPEIDRTKPDRTKPDRTKPDRAKPDQTTPDNPTDDPQLKNPNGDTSSDGKKDTGDDPTADPKIKNPFGNR